MNEAKVVLEVIRSYMENRENAVVQNVDEKALYELAKKHKVSNFLVDWARKSCQSEEIKRQIVEEFEHQIVKDTNEKIEFESILETFERENVQTLVAKGFVMKEVYPQSFMRQMCDIDLLVKEKDFQKAVELLKGLGYCKLENTEHHLVLVKEPFMIVELHRKLIHGEEIGYEYFNQQIWDFAVPYGNYQHIVQMTKEDAYVFCMTHLIRHFKFAGIHIRDVLDVYLYVEKYKEVLNWDEITRKLKEFQIVEFEEKMREIAYRWFGEEEIADFDEIEDFIIGGTSIYNQVNFEVGNQGGKWSFLKKLLFPEFKIMKEKFPVLKKAPILLPVMWIVRLGKDIFSQATSLKGRLETIKLIQEAKSEEVERIQKIYQELGIGRKE